VLVLESGLFAVVWGQQAETTGLNVEVLKGRPHRPVDPDALRQRLEADRAQAGGPTIAAVLTVQTDTATSVRNDIPALRAAIDQAGHPALLFVDCIASLGCEPYEMDAWGADVTVAATQKGLMVPPGVAFAWAGPRAIEAYRSGPDLLNGYLDWGPRLDPQAAYQLFAGTPPIPHLYALDVALDLIDDEGLDERWQRHRILAEAVWAAVEAWEAPGGLRLLVDDPAERSWAVTTVATGDAIDPHELARVTKQRAGVVLGLGVGGLDHCFRIGHMGYLNPPMLLGTLGAIEAALHALGLPQGRSGVAAAAAHLGRHLL
jgi:alanine-glyoxylate transaminase/serine-glyoxylate transaminase/serine-pyruvate transaminase